MLEEEEERKRRGEMAGKIFESVICPVFTKDFWTTLK